MVWRWCHTFKVQGRVVISTTRMAVFFFAVPREMTTFQAVNAHSVLLNNGLSWLGLHRAERLTTVQRARFRTEYTFRRR